MTAHLWFFYALFAAILWGVAYTISEKLLRSGLSPISIMVITEIVTLPILIILALKTVNAAEQIELLKSNPFLIMISVLAALAVIGGNLLILSSIVDKNATASSLIEISYPLFVFIFSWIFFKEIQINWQQAIGGVFIITGVVIIYLKS